MVDKEKRLCKILSKMGWKGRLKSVATLEEAHMIIIEDGQSMIKSPFMDKDTFVRLLDQGHTFPEDKVHFLVHSNPRDARSAVWSRAKFSGNQRHVRRI